MVTPFAPVAATVNLSATGTSSRAQFNATSARADCVRLYNAGTEAVFIAFGDVAIVATTAAGIPIAPGVTEVLSCNGQSYVAGITVGAGPAVLYATPGEGL